MILLADDCLLFELPNGTAVPLRPEMIRFESTGGAHAALDTEAVNEAAAAVFHYFKHELKRTSVSLGEFAVALEKVLTALERAAREAARNTHTSTHTESDLAELAEVVDGVELLFFLELRRLMRRQLRNAIGPLRFRGLRGCVKRLCGLRRWNATCEALSDQIVAYMRECLEAEAADKTCTMIIQ
ncbi:MAG: hypothetical protein N2379_06110 [Verrucomicrobiae bacterium]|nr:hypothetical protein [Verrucomicrobiae bacterium]MDW7980067.1 hypothetical protein [Verrucomicrobiales bacterium]